MEFKNRKEFEENLKKIIDMKEKYSQLIETKFKEVK